MNKLFNVLVLVGVPAAANGCADDGTADRTDDTGLINDRGGSPSPTTTEAPSSKNPSSSGTDDAAAPTKPTPEAQTQTNGDGPSPSGSSTSPDTSGATSGGPVAGDPSGDSGGATGGLGGAPSQPATDSGGAPVDEGPQADGGAHPSDASADGGPDTGPSALDCPPEQWVCEDLTCSTDACLNCGVWVEAQGCRCDPSRPTDPSECGPDEDFVCDAVDPSISDSGRLSCACVSSDVTGLSACSESNPEHQTRAIDDMLCYCAWIHIR